MNDSSATMRDVLGTPDTHLQRAWLPMSDSRGRGRISSKLLPEQARLHNRSLILQKLYRAGAHSRADLARATGLTKVSVSHVVEDLLAEDMLLEVGILESAVRGKPPMMLEFNNAAFQTISIDLSHSTLFRGAVLDPRGTVLSRVDLTIDGRHGHAALDLVMRLIEQLHEQMSGPLLGIGVGTPGVVDAGGVVLRAQSLGWENIDLQSILSSRWGCHVSVANDANLAVQAERSYARGSADMILVRIGHEVGSGILLGGAQVVGSGFAAGEIGHTVAISNPARLCGCGKRGCLETVLASASLDAALKVCRNDDARNRVLASAGVALGSVLAPIISALNLSEIVLSGPRLALDGPLAQAVRAEIHERVGVPGMREVEVRMSEMGDDIVLRGATTQVMRECLGIS